MAHDGSSSPATARERAARSRARRESRRAVEDSVADVQQRQLGAFARGQAIEAGMSAATVDGRVAIGRYRVLLPGVLTDAGTPDSWDLRAMATLLWSGGDVVLARGSAARILGLPVPTSATRLLHLLVSNRCFATPNGLVVHRTRSLDDDDTTSVGALAVTTPTRTVCDLAGELSFAALRKLVSAGVRDGLTDAARLRAKLRRLGRIRGAVQLRAVLDELSPLDAQCNSEFETVFLRVARRFGIEPTAMNHPVRDVTGGRRYLDAVYLPEHVWVELDSERFHGSLLDRNDDAMRTATIEAAGVWRQPLRFTWDDVTQRPAEVAEQIRGALAAARSVDPPVG